MHADVFVIADEDDNGEFLSDIGGATTLMRCVMCCLFRTQLFDLSSPQH